MSEGYVGLPAYYFQSSDPLTTNFGLSLKGMDPIVAENFVIVDSAIAAGAGFVLLNPPGSQTITTPESADIPESQGQLMLRETGADAATEVLYLNAGYIENHTAFASGISNFAHADSRPQRGPVFYSVRSRGTQAAPTGVLSGDTLSEWNTCAHNGTDYKGFDEGSPAFAILVQANENWSTTNQGAVATFFVSAKGALGESPVITLDYIYDATYPTLTRRSCVGINDLAPISSLSISNHENGPANAAIGYASGHQSPINSLDVAGTIRADSGITDNNFLTVQNTTAATQNVPALIATAPATGGTTSALNTTGATLLVAFCTSKNNPSGPTDSKNNTWIAGTEANANPWFAQFYYVLNPVVGTGHTFTAPSQVDGTITVYAFSNIGSIGPQSVATSLAAGAIQPGSITALTNDLVLCGFSTNAITNLTSATVNDGLTATDQLNGAVGIVGGVGYLLATPAGAINPQWTISPANGGNSCLIISFHPSTVSQNSPIFTLAGTFYNSTSSAVDQWTIQVQESTMQNGPSQLVFTQSGTPGAAGVTMPGLTLLTTGELAWGTDTGIARLSAGVLTLNTGTVGSKCAALQLYSGNGSGSGTTGPTSGVILINEDTSGGLHPGISTQAISTYGNGNSANGPLLLAAALQSTRAIIVSAGAIGVGSGNWKGANLQFSTDTGVSRTGAAALAIGNGGAGDITGTLTLKVLAISDTTNGTDLTTTNTTVATVSTTNASPLHQFSANYWTGSASAADTWTIGSVLAAGANGTSQLSISHSGGTTGTVGVSINTTLGMNSFNIDFQGGGVGTLQNTISFHDSTDPGLLFKANNTYGMKLHTALQLSSATPLAWANGAPFSATLDTGFSRASAGVVALGNGTQGDTTGNLQLNQITKYNGESTVAPGVAYIRGSVSQTSSTGAATILTVTPASAAGTYRIRFVASVSTATSLVGWGWTATWTDSNGNAQTPTNLSLFQSGTAAPALTFAATGDYYGETVVDINNAGTNIVVKVTLTSGTLASKVSAFVERLV